MRRVIVLVLLFLLPIEVLAGVVYEPALVHDAQAEKVWFLSAPSVVVHDVSPDTSLLGSESPLQEVSLDLGEASDITGFLLTALGHCATAPPLYIAVVQSSIVLAVPKPPVI